MYKKIGLIGAGKWGSNFIKTIEAMSNVELSVVCTRRGFPINGYKTTPNIMDVVEADVDGVIVATPPDEHYKITLKLLENGVPVLLEKPISTKILECQNLILAARANDVVFRVNYVHLYSNAYKCLKNEVESWDDKAPLRIVSAGGNQGPFRSYNSLYDYGPHDLSMIIKLLGKPYGHEILEDKKTHGSVYLINLFYERATTTSYVGNGFSSKYRKFTVHNMSTGQFVIYDDTTSNKLIVNGKQMNVGTTQPLMNSVQDFIRSLTYKSDWREELELNRHLSLILNSPISAVQ